VEAALRTTGVSRKVDDLGRIVLPAELRKSFDIREGDQIEIAVEEDRIILSKRRSACTFCGERDGLRTFREHPLCASCLAELRRF
jgi:transcriptional pleiotropic regulator of transition state genes